MKGSIHEYAEDWKFGSKMYAIIIYWFLRLVFFILDTYNGEVKQ